MGASPPLVVALMAMGRDTPFLLRDVPVLRAAMDRRVKLAVLVDEARPGELDALAPHVDALLIAPVRSGFAVARRRALLAALAFEPDAVLVCDGDGLFPAGSVAALAKDALANPGAVFVAQRNGHTLPGSGAEPAGASREELERVENAAGALLIRRPDHAERDLQPGAMVMPVDVVRDVLDGVASRDFAWELECVLTLLRLRTRRIVFPVVAAAAQSVTSYVPADGNPKLAMLARHFGRGPLARALDEVREDAARFGVRPALLDELARTLR